MTHHHHYANIKKCTLISALTNLVLAVLKVIIGFIWHSQALVADGLHSFSDLLSDGLVILAAKLGQKHPDPEHPYGHHRIETLAVIIISLILLVVGGLIVYQAVIRFIHADTQVSPGMPVLAVAALSIVANEGLYRYLYNIGKKINSNLIISNAWHNRSDAFTSVIVLISVLGSYLGWTFLDPIGAFIIALFILKMGFKLIYSSFNELIDSSADPQTIDSIQHIIRATEGVVSLHQLRTRMHGGKI